MQESENGIVPEARDE